MGRRIVTLAALLAACGSPAIAPDFTVGRDAALGAGAPQCSEIVPQAAPSFDVAEPETSRTFTCLGGTSDGAGNLALARVDPRGVVQNRVVSPDGQTEYGVIDGHWTYPLAPQALGFHGIDIGIHSRNVTFLAARPQEGALAWTVEELFASHDRAYAFANSAVSGSLVALAARGASSDVLWSVTLIRFDARGASSRTVVEQGGGFRPDAAVVGDDVRGHALVLWDASAEGEAWGTFFGRWVSPAGKPYGRRFVALRGVDPYAELALSPLVNGGLALQLNGEWVAQFRAGAPIAFPPPPWLASRPGTRLALVRGGAAYAVLPPPNGGCGRAIELLTRSGRSCGALDLGAAGVMCQALDLDVGRDGTVIAELPSGDGSCAHRIWPGLLR